jgi:hypothetical protein
MIFPWPKRHHINSESAMTKFHGFKNGQRMTQEAYDGFKEDFTAKLKVMDDYRAVALAEGTEEGTEEEKVLAWQHLIDTGLAWTLQGFFGRTAQALINEGICHV